MRFCEKCDNMYYLKIDDSTETNNIIYYCRNCKFEDKKINLDNLSVFKYSKEVKQSTNKINSFTKFDPTLPRVNTIKCPNDECETNTQDKEREVIYIRYDDTKMKYMYLCTHCSVTWET